MNETDHLCFAHREDTCLSIPHPILEEPTSASVSRRQNSSSGELLDEKCTRLAGFQSSDPWQTRTLSWPSAASSYKVLRLRDCRLGSKIPGSFVTSAPNPNADVCQWKPTVAPHTKPMSVIGTEGTWKARSQISYEFHTKCFGGAAEGRSTLPRKRTCGLLISYPSGSEWPGQLTFVCGHSTVVSSGPPNLNIDA